MSYPINQALTYTAVATTTGAPTDTFTYAWAFDDGGTGNTASLGHTWTTAGNHLATVTATDNQTGGTASAQNTIKIDYFDWVQQAARTSTSDANLCVTMNDGNVLFIDISTGNCYRYNPTANSWSSTTNIGVSILGSERYHQIFTLPSGKVLLSGLTSSQLATRIFNPVGDTWSNGPSMSGHSNGESKYTAIKLFDGRIFNYSYGNPWTIQIYDESLNTWAVKASPLAGAPNFNYGPVMMVQLDSDRVYVQGVYGGTNSFVAQIYSISGNSWSYANIPPSVNYTGYGSFPDLINGGNGYIYWIGYGNSYTATRLSAKYSIADGTWTALTGYTSPGGSSQDPFIRYLVAGGSKILVVGYTYSIIYDLAGDIYSTPITDYVSSPGYFNGGVILSDGRPFVITAASTSCQIFQGTY